MCEICYWPASTTTSNCQQQSDTLTCRDIPVGDHTDLSTLLDNDGTYCYRAMAIVNGTPVVVTQDTFNKRQRISGRSTYIELATPKLKIIPYHKLIIQDGLRLVCTNAWLVYLLL